MRSEWGSGASVRVTARAIRGVNSTIVSGGQSAGVATAVVACFCGTEAQLLDQRKRECSCAGVRW